MPPPRLLLSAIQERTRLFMIDFRRPCFHLRSVSFGLLFLLLAIIALPCRTAVAETPSNPPIAAISTQGLKDIARDVARHVGDAPSNPGPRAHLSGALRPADVHAAMRKVANWELARAQPYFARTWTWSVLYAGFMAATPALHDPRYRDAMLNMARRFHWELHSRVPDANRQGVAQTYLQLYLLDPAPQEIAPTQQALGRLLAGAAAPIPDDQAKIPWWWCDSLFMSPPVWSRMYAATHDRKYLAYIDQHWWQTSGLLYDQHWHLYYRDITWLHRSDPLGKPVFWSRGNGWVMAGLARTLEYMPSSERDRARYVHQLRQMAAAIAPLQDPHSGLWHSDLLDGRDYPQPEASGSALMTFALAWGVNHGVLSRARYLPVIAKAWSGLVGQIYADGRLGNIQQSGDAPAHYLPSSSYNYGIGAFLLAGAQLEQLAGWMPKRIGGVPMSRSVSAP